MSHERRSRGLGFAPHFSRRHFPDEPHRTRLDVCAHVGRHPSRPTLASESRGSYPHGGPCAWARHRGPEDADSARQCSHRCGVAVDARSHHPARSADRSLLHRSACHLSVAGSDGVGHICADSSQHPRDGLCGVLHSQHPARSRRHGQEQDHSADGLVS